MALDAMFFKAEMRCFLVFLKGFERIFRELRGFFGVLSAGFVRILGPFGRILY